MVVAFLALVLGLSQLAPARGGAAGSAAAEPAVARARADLERLRHVTGGEPAVDAATQLVSDLDVPAVDPRVRSRFVARAIALVGSRCGDCVDVLQRPPQEHGSWARKTIGLAP